MNTPHDAVHTLTPLATVRLVAGREIAERLRSRLIWIMTALTPLLVVALIVIPALVRQPAKPTVVGLVGPSAQALGPSLHGTARAAKVDIRVEDVANSAVARSELKKGSLDVALSVDAHAAVAEVRGSLGSFQVQTLSPTLRAVLQATMDAAHQRRVLAEAGVPLATVRAAMAPVPFSTRTLHPPPTDLDLAAHAVAALATGFLLYLSVAAYGGAVAAGVAQEKTSRMAEILLATVRPSQLLAGKVVRIGVCGLGQIGIAVVAGLLANAAVQSAAIPSTVWVLLPTVLLWFVLGYALYAFALAAAGALVGRQEEVQFVTLPFVMPLVGGFLLTYAAIAAPDARWIHLLSFLPPLAPVLMPARLALGSVAAWEMPVAVLIMVVGVYGMVRLAARIYAPAVVRGGARLSWSAALRLRQE
jgi:ABC-2 type transport system permease protein